MARNSKKAICLVTGGAGFIGSHLIEGLLDEGWQVRVLDNLSKGKIENISAFLPFIEWIGGDIRDFSIIKKACQGAASILHHAALASVIQSIQDPLLAHEVNVTGTVNVLEAARQAGVGKVVFASSAAVYGADPHLPKTEDSLLKPISPYGLSKLVGEQYCQLYAKLFNLNVVCFRYFNVFGPRQNLDSQYSGVISIFVNNVLEGNDPTVFGDGFQTRDFIHVDDIKRANLHVLSSDIRGFNVYNVANGVAHSLYEILEWLKSYTKRDFTIRYQPDRRGDLRHSTASIEKIKNELGYKPEKSFYDGLQEFADFTSSILVKQ